MWIQWSIWNPSTHYRQQSRSIRYICAATQRIWCDSWSAGRKIIRRANSDSPRPLAHCRTGYSWNCRSQLIHPEYSRTRLSCADNAARTFRFHCKVLVSRVFQRLWRLMRSGKILSAISERQEVRRRRVHWASHKEWSCHSPFSISWILIVETNCPVQIYCKVTMHIQYIVQFIAMAGWRPVFRAGVQRMRLTLKCLTPIYEILILVWNLKSNVNSPNFYVPFLNPRTLLCALAPSNTSDLEFLSYSGMDTFNAALMLSCCEFSL